MKTIEIWQGNTCIAGHVAVADSFSTRFRGLMLRKSLAPGEGLLLKNCPSIHCCFMRFPIDAVYLDSGMTVVGIETVKPWRIGRFFSGAKHVLELAEHRGSCLQVGMKLTWKETQPQ